MRDFRTEYVKKMVAFQKNCHHEYIINPHSRYKKCKKCGLIKKDI